MDARRSLRQHLRQHRRSLSARQRRTLSRQLARRLSTHPLFLRSRHIAVYLANDGEVDLGPLIRRIWRAHKSCYLPILHPLASRLWFLPYQPHSRLRRNRFGIPEPRGRHRRAPWGLDLVLTPLVGFDGRGNRLGMGGGYYDRSFAYLRRRAQRPRLLGIAYAFQETGNLDSAAWDVPLWGVATEFGVRQFSTRD